MLSKPFSAPATIFRCGQASRNGRSTASVMKAISAVASAQTSFSLSNDNGSLLSFEMTSPTIRRVASVSSSIQFGTMIFSCIAGVPLFLRIAIKAR